MTSFAKVWAIKSPTMLNPGAIIPVSIKRGGTRDAEVGAFLYDKGDYYFYAASPKNKDPE